MEWNRIAREFMGLIRPALTLRPYALMVPFLAGIFVAASHVSGALRS